MEAGMISKLFLLLQLLQVVFSFVNLSFNKTADMSSSQYSDKWLADKAADGDVSQKVTQGSCAVTSDNFHKQAWWRVDLGDVYVLNSVKIYYRTDDDPAESLTYWLSGFSIYVADTLNWWIGTRCYLDNNGQHTDTGPSDILTVPCNATGRYVTVYKQRNGSCTWNQNAFYKRFCAKIELCEVQVLSCENGRYGESCKNNCSGNCLNGDHCNKTHGGCDDGCAPGYRGFACHDRSATRCLSDCQMLRMCEVDRPFQSTGVKLACNFGSYGKQCLHMCKSCTETCHHVTGQCLVFDKQRSVENKSDTMIAIIVTFGVIIIVLSVALSITCLHWRNQCPPNVTISTRSNTIHGEQGRVQLSDMNSNKNNTEMSQKSVTQTSSRVTYEDLNMPTPTESNTYESLQPDREVAYTNT